jgi:hypothetical protein
MAPSEAGGRWLAAGIIGLAFPFAVLSSLMPLGLLFLVLLAVWIRSNPERLAATAGLLIGFGSTTLALFLVANAGCAVPGTCYESSPALPAAAAVIGVGIVMTVARLARD